MGFQFWFVVQKACDENCRWGCTIIHTCTFQLHINQLWSEILDKMCIDINHVNINKWIRNLLMDFDLKFMFNEQGVEDYSMLREGDRVLVCLSGGKDSLSLLHTIRQYQFYCKAKVWSVHISFKQHPYWDFKVEEVSVVCSLKLYSSVSHWWLL